MEYGCYNTSYCCLRYRIRSTGRASNLKNAETNVVVLNMCVDKNPKLLRLLNHGENHEKSSELGATRFFFKPFERTVFDGTHF